MSTAMHIGQAGINLLGKNQDVPYDGTYLFTNKRGVAKRAMVMPPDQPVEWVSRYGSITVSQVGKEMPNGGMNEAGLVVEQTTLWQSSYPESSSLPAIGELPWIQLLLDTCAVVQEAIEAASIVRIIQPMSRLHYMVADRAGQCAVIEFLHGKMNVYSGEDLPISVLANTPYLEAVKDLGDGEATMSNVDDDYCRNSMKRFAIAAATVTQPVLSKAEDPLDFMFEVLRAAEREDTAYSLVYDLEKIELHFLSNRYRERKTVRLSELDVSLDSEAMALHLQQSARGDCKDLFVAYNSSINRMIVESFFRDPVLTKAFRWTITEEMIDFVASFPDGYPCIES
ncbi:hypothetical protein BVG16_18830 [Paenibacillus selenitireducens]|uniref:Peptidase C45 hydrolase domain-containing protein n=1 Tax=Paenibacillus selenitireducens TaxID=1324314 RepID=A0A1T2X8P6_9BACL|nr:linear amide C-N hydrolase [Paenibacillus selenitireducens]OPA76251.1 hypothetical protein BVG16_18830 [Paenibacillus selenitireducens]